MGKQEVCKHVKEQYITEGQKKNRKNALSYIFLLITFLSLLTFIYFPWPVSETHLTYSLGMSTCAFTLH